MPEVRASLRLKPLAFPVAYLASLHRKISALRAAFRLMPRKGRTSHRLRPEDAHRVAAAGSLRRCGSAADVG